MAVLERPEQPAGLRRILADANGEAMLNGLVAFLFSCTAPVAIIITVAQQGGLTQAEIASWLWGAFVIGGCITLLFCILYRQPITFAWTIPGTVLLAPAFASMSFAEMIGAFMVTGALMTVIGFSGLVRRAMEMTPMPIVMGMVAGVFLDFGLGMIDALGKNVAVALPMVLAYVAAGSVPAVARRCPPIVAALIAGAVSVAVAGGLSITSETPALAQLPLLFMPEFSWTAIVELVVPIAITVLVVQNGQGLTILRASGHTPPMNAATVACGIGSVLFALVGSVCTCVTGPATAVLSSSGDKEKQYIGGLTYGGLFIVFGIFASTATWLALALPAAFIATLGGLGVLRVLENAFVAAFSGRFTLGALISLLVTVSDIQILNIGAAFWGLVFGIGISLLIEREDYVAERDAREADDD